jgi:hypothetical protein
VPFEWTVGAVMFMVLFFEYCEASVDALAEFDCVEVLRLAI